MNNYEHQIRLERKFTKQIKAILGLQFIGQDPIMDKEQGTDFLVFSIKPIKVGIRLRTYNYYLKPEYRRQFTIRYKLASGNKTEYQKIKEGLVDYILYGFVNEDETKIIQYFIGDLDVFRDYEDGMKTEECKNKDNNPSWLKAYYVGDFPSRFVIKNYNLPRRRY